MRPAHARLGGGRRRAGRRGRRRRGRVARRSRTRWLRRSRACRSRSRTRPTAPATRSRSGLRRSPAAPSTCSSCRATRRRSGPRRCARCARRARPSGVAGALAVAQVAPPHAYGRVVRDGERRSSESSRRATRAPTSSGSPTSTSGSTASAPLRSRPRSRGSSRTTPRASATSPTSVALLEGSVVAVDEVDVESCAGINSMLELAAVDDQLRRRLLDEAMLAGVRIVDPANTWIDRDVHARARQPDRAVLPAAGRHDGRGGRCRRALRRRARTPRSARLPGRAVRLPASRHGAARAGRRRALRRAQGRRDRQRLEGAAPLLPRRRDRRRRHVNIGAGTITANYDGHEKHRTDDRATALARAATRSLVAPVRVGTGADGRSGIGDHRRCSGRRARDRASASDCQGGIRRAGRGAPRGGSATMSEQTGTASLLGEDLLLADAPRPEEAAVASYHDREPIRRMMVFSGRSNPDLARASRATSGLTLGDVELKTFPNGELYVRFGESIRGADVFLIQSCSTPVQPEPDGAAADGERGEARLGQAHHGRHAVVSVLARRQEVGAARADHRAPRGRPPAVLRRRSRPDDGPPRGPGAGLLQHPGRSHDRAADVRAVLPRLRACRRTGSSSSRRTPVASSSRRSSPRCSAAISPSSTRSAPRTASRAS